MCGEEGGCSRREGRKEDAARETRRWRTLGGRGHRGAHLKTMKGGTVREVCGGGGQWDESHRWMWSVLQWVERFGGDLKRLGKVWFEMDGGVGGLCIREGEM